jgi:anti-anti-sigma factor
MNGLLAIGTLTNPIEHQQAPALQRIFLTVTVAATLAVVIFLALLGTTPAGLILASAATLVVITSLLSVWLLRRGLFPRAALLCSAGLMIAVSFVIFTFGYPAATTFFVVFFIPVVLIGLVAQVRLLVLITVLSALVSLLSVALTPVLAPIHAQVAPNAALTLVSVALFLLVLGVIVAIVWLFGITLRRALQDALDREQALTALQATLETTVAERTHALQAALHLVEQREAQTRATLEQLQSSQEMVRELSAPVLPVLPGVLVAPLVGAIDSARAATFTANVLEAVQQQQANHVIFDVTAVPVVDTQVAQVLIQTAQSVRLLGAHVLLAGIRPEVAQTLVGIGVTLEHLHPYADLRQAITQLATRGARVPRLLQSQN